MRNILSLPLGLSSRRARVVAEKTVTADAVVASTPARAKPAGICDGCFELAWGETRGLRHSALINDAAHPSARSGADASMQYFYCMDCGHQWRWHADQGWEPALPAQH